MRRAMLAMCARLIMQPLENGRLAMLCARVCQLNWLKQEWILPEKIIERISTVRKNYICNIVLICLTAITSYCGNPHIITNGIVTLFLTTTQVGGNATLSCQPGYIFVGNNSNIICTVYSATYGAYSYPNASCIGAWLNLYTVTGNSVTVIS